MKLVAAVDKLKEKYGIQIVPIFVVVDLERDTVEQVAEHVKGDYVILHELHFMSHLERSASYGGRQHPIRPPPDLPSLLLIGRIVYIGMPIKTEINTLAFGSAIG
ncbi:ATP-dependent caseinolytic (Clp) protease/crotonase family protein [Trifolium repens]|nr:ATP-dependent caseinolytic (Clp) protease/crotonase family protein [Trifolium repens]